MRVRGYAPATPCWVELQGSDPEAASAFYSGLFGWQPVSGGGDLTVFTLRDLAVAGMVPTSPGKRSSWLVHISTEDAAATAERVIAAGGRVLRPPAEVGDRGTASRLADAEGAVFGVWQRGGFAGAQLANEAGAVCWSEVATWDPAGAAAFYHKVFGWTDQPGQLAGDIEYRDWQVGNRVVAGMLPMDSYFPAHAPAHWRLTVEVDACAAVTARCVELGGEVVIGPMDIGVGRYAQLLDPLGAAIGVVEFLPAFRLTV